MQCWNSYSIEELNNEINPSELFSFESGFSINGKIKNYPSGYDIGLLSKQNRFVSFSKFTNSNEFTFENIFAFKNDTLKLSPIKKDKPLVKPNKVVFLKPSLNIRNYNFLTSKFRQTNIKIEDSTSSSENKNYSNYVYGEN